MKYFSELYNITFRSYVSSKLGQYCTVYFEPMRYFLKCKLLIFKVFFSIDRTLYQVEIITNLRFCKNLYGNFSERYDVTFQSHVSSKLGKKCTVYFELIGYFSKCKLLSFKAFFSIDRTLYQVAI